MSSDFETLKNQINSELKKLKITADFKAPDSSDGLPKFLQQLMMSGHNGGKDDHNYGVAKLAGLVQQYITDNNIKIGVTN